MSMRIGRLFVEENSQGPRRVWYEQLGDSVQFYMSGRCALYACLLDIAPRCQTKIAYVPAYSCETVLNSYLRAGYSLLFYDIASLDLEPIFDEAVLKSISVINICGYYGFSRYNQDFILRCKQQGIVIIQDTTHSLFSSDGHSPLADYYAGSLRKWLGVACGGIAIKKNGVFLHEPLPFDSEHVEGRYEAMAYSREAVKTGQSLFEQKAMDVFWKTEYRLRSMFDRFGSDQASIDIIDHLEWDEIVLIRRQNYQTILDFPLKSEACCPVFPQLDAVSCPSHFAFYSADRACVQKKLIEKGIRSTIYWPLPPMLEPSDQYSESLWIYEHILSVQIDQRYSCEDMQYLGNVLSSL
jgi:dTDP-4-amino-4,6-dideoxygalactose transaminase